MKKIWLSSPHMGENEWNYLQEAFQSNWIAPLGPAVDGFEKDLADYLKVNAVAALSSGTAAMHLALQLLGIGHGDFVICQSFTFAATANPIRYVGATPVFVDSEEETWNMDPECLQRGIDYCINKGALPKAIIPVHVYGMPAQMDAIRKIALEYGIPVIEDAAEALGSTYHGKPCGSLGLFGILSFNGNKIITTSGGGALVSNNEQMIAQARFLATQARDPAPHYQHSVIGYNYRLSNICAAIGRGQMEVLPHRVDQRRANYDFYYSRLSGLAGINFVEELPGLKSNRWLTTITVDENLTGGINREALRHALLHEQIESRPLWKPMHLQLAYKDAPMIHNGVSDRLFDQGLCLPSGSNLTLDQLDEVVRTIEAQFF